MKRLVLDTETVIDLAVARRVLNLPNASDADVRQAVHFSDRLTSDKGFPRLAICKIICIATLEVETSEFNREILESKIKCQRVLRADEFGGEAGMLAEFAKILRAASPGQLISYNGGSFDLPVIRFRGMRHGVPMPELYAIEHHDVMRFWYRYSEGHLDLSDHLSSYGSCTQIGLDELARTLGLPGKPEGMDGSMVEPAYLDGRMDEIAEYCASDVVNTYRVWLRYELHRGRLTEQAFAVADREAACEKIACVITCMDEEQTVPASYVVDHGGTFEGVVTELVDERWTLMTVGHYPSCNEAMKAVWKWNDLACADALRSMRPDPSH
jgi:predicted PolB exonuclease-like 3'-5' exonuclease